MLSTLSRHKVAFALSAALAVASPLSFNSAALADSNVSTVATSSASIAAKPTRNYNFPQWDDSKKSTHFVKAAAESASTSGLIVVAWGGTYEQQKQAWLAVADLHNNGKKVGFIKGPDVLAGGPDKEILQIQIEIYGKGAAVFAPSVIGKNHTDKIREGVLDLARDAYRKTFPTLVSLNID